MVNPPDWAMVEQDLTGLWWITTDTTTGPYLDEVQALRALQTQPDPPRSVVVVHTTTTAAPPLQCVLQTTATRPQTTEGGA